MEIRTVSDIRIKIPSGVNAHWDTSDVSATLWGTAAANVNSMVSFPDTKTLLLEVDTDFMNGANLIISGLSVLGDAASSSGALQWSVDGGMTYGTAHSSTTITVNASDAKASLSLANPGAGAVQDTTLTLDLAVSLNAMDTITFTAPGELNVSGLSASVTGTLEGSSNITCAAAGQNVTCTIDGASAAPASGLTIIMTGITGAYVGTTDVTNLAVNDVSLGGADINVDATVPMTDIICRKRACRK